MTKSIECIEKLHWKNWAVKSILIFFHFNFAPGVLTNFYVLRVNRGENRFMDYIYYLVGQKKENDDQCKF